jgi:hypothetical protein
VARGTVAACLERASQRRPAEAKTLTRAETEVAAADMTMAGSIPCAELLCARSSDRESRRRKCDELGAKAKVLQSGSNVEGSKQRSLGHEEENA